MPAVPAALVLWRDRSGRLSGLRVATLAVLVAPLLWLVWRAGSGDLGARPITEALRYCGDRAVETLIAAIAVTPLRRLSGWSRLVGVRRMIGVASFLWAILHFGLYALDQQGDVGRIASEIAVRPYLTIGFLALAGLAALAVTSTDGMIRRLGGPAWGRLHGLVHPIAILALVHLFLQVRLDPAWAATVAGIATGGLAARIAARRGEVGPVGVLGAAACAWGGAAASEVLWFAIKTKRPLEPVVLADFDWSFRISASGWAAGLVLAVGLAALARRAWQRRPIRRETISAS